MSQNKILIVEKDDTSRRLLEVNIEDLGYRLTGAAKSGEEGVLLALQNPPDLILMGMQLHGEVDGMEASRRIRAAYDVPIIFTGTQADTATLQRANENDPSAFLIQPVDRASLKAAIELGVYRHKMDRQLRQSEERYRAVMEQTSEGIFLMDTETGQMLESNPAFQRLLGLSAEEITRLSMAEIFAPLHQSPIQSTPHWRRIHQKGLFECEMKREDGEPVHAEVQLNEIFYHDRKVICGISHDITGRKRLEAAEREQRVLAEALRDTAAALNSTLDPEEVLNRLQTSIARVIPHDAASYMRVEDGVARIVRAIAFSKEIQVEADNDLLVPVSQMPGLQRMAVTRKPLAIPDTYADPDWVRNEQTEWIRSGVSAPVFAHDQLIGFINLGSAQPGFYTQAQADLLQGFADQAAIALENARLYSEVQRLAITDPLTQLYNRRGLIEFGQREVAFARRFGHPLTALLLDIDYFKQINDQYGHSVGDEVLREVGRRLLMCTREIDIVCRYGGEEFVLLLPLTSVESALMIAQRIQTLFKEIPVPTRNGDQWITFSIGIAMYHPDFPDLQSLIETADKAMYTVKQTGRNSIRVL